jgi:RNA polymerase II subunit A small phosphatase-like protein
VWSSSTAPYAEAVVSAAFPEDCRPLFVWGRNRCVRRFDPELQEQYFLKDLNKVKRRGFNLDRI